MIQRLSRPGEPPTTIDYGPGPFGDEDVRLIRMGRNPEAIGAVPAGDGIPPRADMLINANAERHRQWLRRKRKRNGGVA
jgi:hypothetical protein